MSLCCFQLILCQKGSQIITLCFRYLLHSISAFWEMFFFFIIIYYLTVKFASLCNFNLELLLTLKLIYEFKFIFVTTCVCDCIQLSRRAS